MLSTKYNQDFSFANSYTSKCQCFKCVSDALVLTIILGHGLLGGPSLRRQQPGFEHQLCDSGTTTVGSSLFYWCKIIPPKVKNNGIKV